MNNMRILVKDSNNNVLVLNSPLGFIPAGFTKVAQEDISIEELKLARKDKLEEIRASRNKRLKNNDKAWLIASKTGASLTAIEAEAQNLRDIPEMAEDELALLETIEEIKAYNPFEA